jgi:hypothetical protein
MISGAALSSSSPETEQLSVKKRMNINRRGLINPLLKRKRIIPLNDINPAMMAIIISMSLAARKQNLIKNK